MKFFTKPLAKQIRSAKLRHTELETKEKDMKMHLRLVTAAALTLSVCAIEAGNITGKVTLKGTPPPNKSFKMDPICGRFHPINKFEMEFYKVAKDGSLGDVLVTLKGVKGKTPGSAAAPVVIDQVNCIYIPYVSSAQTGQTITVKNSDPLMHNVHPTPKNVAGGNKEKNIAQVIKGQKNNFSFPAPERFLRFKCDIHQWMYSYISIEEHPWSAVTAADGTFTIKNVPPGDYEVEAVHRKIHFAKDYQGDVQKVKVTADGGKANFTLNVPK
ncbi:MAG: plastocyanin [Candidatus Binatia bacterium]